MLDAMVEQPEGFTVVLSNPSDGLGLGAADRASVTIMDNEGATVEGVDNACFQCFIFHSTVPTVRFDTATFDVPEGGQVSLRVVLSFAADGPVTVDFTTNDGSANGKQTDFEITGA